MNYDSIDWQAILDNVPDGAEDWTHYDINSDFPYKKVCGLRNFFWGSAGWTAMSAPLSKLTRQEIEKNALMQNCEKAYQYISGVTQAWDSAITSSTTKSKYHREIKPGVWVDVYDVLHAFDPDNRNAADDHAIKKMLLPGKRGHKDGIKDRKEAIQSLERSVQIIEENQ